MGRKYKEEHFPKQARVHDLTLPKRKLNLLISQTYPRMDFGDYILFQEYKEAGKDEKGNNIMSVTKPIFAISLGMFAADQTMGMNYVRWINETHTEIIVNEHGRHEVGKEVDSIQQHIEWNDYIDILGVWKHKPNWKEIMFAYRQQNANKIVLSDDIDWERS